MRGVELFFGFFTLDFASFGVERWAGFSDIRRKGFGLQGLSALSLLQALRFSVRGLGQLDTCMIDKFEHGTAPRHAVGFAFRGVLHRRGFLIESFGS